MHIYIIPATNKETRNPNGLHEILPIVGKLVINTRQVHRARNQGSVLIVPFLAAQGIPQFDNEHPQHQAAKSAYELLQIDDEIARAEKHLEDRQNVLKEAQQASDDLQKQIETAKQKCFQAHENLINVFKINDRLAKIETAIKELENGNEKHWTLEGKPEVKAINKILNKNKKEGEENIKISAAQRDEIWLYIQDNN